jgi:ketosteroid isomerase-like protein
MTDAEFSRFLSRYHAATRHWMMGDPKPWAEICSHADSVSAFEAWGGSEKGWTDIGRHYAEKAAPNRGGEIRFETVQQMVTPDVAIVADIVRGTIQLSGSPVDNPFALRVTAVFRKERGEWLLVHRHADPMVQRPT